MSEQYQTALMGYTVTIRRESDHYQITIPSFPFIHIQTDSFEQAAIEAKAALLTVLERYEREGWALPKDGDVPTSSSTLDALPVCSV